MSEGFLKKEERRDTQAVVNAMRAKFFKAGRPAFSFSPAHVPVFKVFFLFLFFLGGAPPPPCPPPSQLLHVRKSTTTTTTKPTISTTTLSCHAATTRSTTISCHPGIKVKVQSTPRQSHKAMCVKHVCMGKAKATTNACSHKNVYAVANAVVKQSLPPPGRKIDRDGI